MISSVQRQEANWVEHAAEDQPDRRATAGDGAVDAERPGPLAGLGEGDGEQRQRGGRHHGGECALQGAGAEQHRRVLGEPAERGRGAEPEQADR